VGGFFSVFFFGRKKRENAVNARYFLEQVKHGIVIDQVLVQSRSVVRVHGVPAVAEQKRIPERVLGFRGKARPHLLGEVPFDQFPIL